MQIFDTHCHYNLDPFLPNWESFWQAAKLHGVTDSTVVSVDIETSKTAISLAEKETHFHPVIGCHPGYYQELIEKEPLDSDEITQKKLLQLIEVEKKELLSLISPVVAGIGETGLDYFRMPTERAELIKDIQKKAFQSHIEIAQETGLPLIIHARDKNTDAYADILQTLKEMQFSGKFVLHCVSGPVGYVQEAVKMGGYVGLAGNITYKNSEQLREIAAFTSIDRILIETDAPFLPPIPFRGKTCEPWMIENTAKYVAEELQLDLDRIYQNSFEVFIRK